MADPLKLYLKDIKDIPLLKAEEEISLAKAIKKGDEGARKQMIQSNLRLVISIAKRYNNLGMPISDLIEEGNLELMRAVRKQVTDLLGPSRFACDVLRSYAERRLVNEKGEALRTGVSLWQHGVSSAFAWKPLSPELRGKPFTAIHFASTARQRKGTAEVIQAWTNLVLRRALGSLPTLRIVLDGPEKAFADLVAQDVGIVVERPLNLPAAAMADLYRSVHVVVQPSRGEGFGLCPLEARCCGAVVVATACTGHAEYLSPLDYLCVKTGELAPIDDGPGAMAPSLRVEDVARALNNAFTLWSNPHARLYDPDMWKTWTWKNVTADWIAREEVTW